jgi:hypothetical protein
MPGSRGMLERDILMDKELAQVLACILQGCSGLLNHTVWLMKCHGTEEEFLEHRKAVARVMAELGINLLYPIYDEYPDLDPSSPTFSGERLGQSPEKPPQVENPPGMPDPGDRNS